MDVCSWPVKVSFLLTILFLSHGGLARAEDNKAQQAGQLPPELQGAKIYKLPEAGKPGGPPENPIIYKEIAYDDVNLERLVLKLSVSLKPFDKAAKIKRIYFQNVRANDIPVQVETLEEEFELSKKEVVDLPAPLKCTVVFSDLESLAPIKEMISQDKVSITGQSFIEVKLGTLQKIAVRAKRLVLPIQLEEEVPLRMFSDRPLVRMAAVGILDTLTNPASGPAIALAKEHFARIAGNRTLEQKSEQSLYLLYSEYVLRDPQSGASEKFSQSGTGFLVSADGKLATAKRVVEPWKFDPEIALLISRDHLEVDVKSVQLAAWPAGATVLAGDGMPDLAAALSTEKQTLQVLGMSPDRFEKLDYQDADSGVKTNLEIHAGGESDIALLQLSGSGFQPLEFAPESAISPDSKLSLLGFPFGLSQEKATPRPAPVSAVVEGETLVLGGALNPGQSGAPLVTPEGKVAAMCAEPNRCVSVESICKLIP